MKRLLLLIVLFASAAAAQQSPHGPIKIACETCHSTEAWTIRTDAVFNHNSTGFPLEGRHQSTTCRSCHENLVFTSKSPDCASCHADVHQKELGPNCLRCHTTESWVVADMRSKHEGTRFPLLGRHSLINCDDCHTRASSHRFAGMPITCIACHTPQYDATTAPNHAAAGFGVECMSCHRVNDLSWPGGFDHNLTSFPLVGAHASLLCADCHKNNNFGRLSVNCYDCHKADFERPQNPNHATGGFSQQCLSCHTMDAWRPASFDHSVTNFPLTGKHTRLECQTCHKNGNYQLVYADCYQCHSSDFSGVSSPNHVSGNFSHNCLTCHTTSGWDPATFSHAATNFPLTGSHTSAECQACHANGNYQIAFTDCYQCHSTDFNQVSSPNHVAGDFNHNCLSCHNTVAWQPGFDHNSTTFPLSGAHTSIECQSCHVNGNFQLAYTDCNQCHSADFNQAANPNHVSGNFSRNCLTCHSTAAWQPATFDHGQTRFPLTGKHTTTLCQTCHTNGNYQLTYTDCYQCHQGDFTQTTNPNHVSGNFSHDCLTCHTTAGWEPASFDHNQTSLPLTGAHTTIQCAACHTNNNYQLAYADCYQCHQPNFELATNPNHVTGNFSHSCLTCHTTTAWQPAAFDHAASQFPLTGAHTTIQCASCHVGGNYQLTYANCYQCHQPEFEQTTNPNHVAQNFSQNCITCHTTAAWDPASFDHAQTQFALTGAHAAVACATCHANNNYQLAYADCYQCHQTDFAQPTDPNHVTQNFSHDCLTCHTTVSWDPPTFNHSQTQLALTGAHTTIQCVSCHVGGNYQLTYADCYQCHQPAFELATDPNHVTQIISHDCLTCHNSAAWQPATFDHNQTGLPLTGAHTAIQCVACHAGGNYQLTYASCYQCHQANFEQTTNPNHVTQNLSHDCVSCHTTTAWQPASFDHNQTQFALTGAHTTIQCVSCHAGGNYQLTYANCYQCHQANFEQTTNPNHLTQSIGQNCVSCHTTTAWQPASYDHNQTQFPLTGAHTAIQCASCHANGNYQLTYADCYQCHRPDFELALAPNHVTQNFAHDCLTCHSTAAWQPATFDHSQTQLPLTGAHTTIECASCHVNGNFALAYTSCYQCHQPDFESTTNPNHLTQSISQNCVTCHTTAAWQPASFDHAQTNFPLTGGHTAIVCTSCHINGNYQLTYASCYQCHQPEFEQTTNPNHVAQSFSQDCLTCHTTAAWSPATFNHAQTDFALTGAHTTIQCASCHVSGNYQLSYADCYQCHTPDFERPTDPDHVLPNFAHDCLSCHTTAAWLPTTFQHDALYFRIYSGRHRGQWTTCATCHGDPANYASFTCFNCHTHNKADTDSHHTGVSGYTYTSAACYTCHKRV